MNKDQLQKELKEKIKAGVKPSHLKKKPIKPKPKQDEGYLSGEEEKIIPTIPTPPPNLLALQKQIELHKEIKKADEKKKQELQQKISDLEKTIQDLDYLLKTGKNSEIIKKLRTENKNLIEKYINLENQAKSKGEVKEPTNKTFFCDSCQSTKLGTYIIRKIDSPFEPRLHGRTCYLCSSCSPYCKELNDTNFDKDNNPYKY